MLVIPIDEKETHESKEYGEKSILEPMGWSKGHTKCDIESVLKGIYMG
jgi:hypothetical protein